MAILRGIWGTDAEMRHPTALEETREKVAEAESAIDHMREATDKLSRLEPAKDLDQALRQLTRES